MQVILHENMDLPLHGANMPEKMPEKMLEILPLFAAAAARGFIG